MQKFWLSWVHSDISMGIFELNSPWWITGYNENDESICAAVRARDMNEAMQMINAAYDKPPALIRWRFVEERASNWSPFSSRFPKQEWMKWDDDPGVLEHS